MKKVILIMALISLTMNLFAQEKVKQTQVGLVFNNLDNFGLSFKKGSNKFMWRFNAMSLSGLHQKIGNDSIVTNGFGFSFSVGNEFIKKVSENFELCFGYDFSYSYGQQKRTEYYAPYYKDYIKSIYKGPGINLVFGLNCIIKDHLIIGAELLPFYSQKKMTNYDGNDITGNKDKVGELTINDYGFSNSSARVTIAYRF